MRTGEIRKTLRSYWNRFIAETLALEVDGYRGNGALFDVFPGPVMILEHLEISHTENEMCKQNYRPKAGSRVLIKNRAFSSKVGGSGYQLIIALGGSSLRMTLYLRYGPLRPEIPTA